MGALTFCVYFFIFFMGLIVTCRLCIISVSEGNDSNVLAMITWPVWTLWFPISSVRKRPINLITHSPLWFVEILVTVEDQIMVIHQWWWWLVSMSEGMGGRMDQWMVYACCWSAGIRSAENSVPETMGSNPVFSRGRQLFSSRFHMSSLLSVHQN